jgi:hypothetical protein
MYQAKLAKLEFITLNGHAQVEKYKRVCAIFPFQKSERNGAQSNLFDYEDPTTYICLEIDG